MIDLFRQPYLLIPTHPPPCLKSTVQQRKPMHDLLSHYLRDLQFYVAEVYYVNTTTSFCPIQFLSLKKGIVPQRCNQTAHSFMIDQSTTLKNTTCYRKHWHGPTIDKCPQILPELIYYPQLDPYTVPILHYVMINKTNHPTYQVPSPWVTITLNLSWSTHIRNTTEKSYQISPLHWKFGSFLVFKHR